MRPPPYKISPGQRLGMIAIITLALLLLWLHRVPRHITAEDKVYLELFLQEVPAAEATTYEAQLAQLSAIQQAILRHAPPGEGIPEGRRREPRDLWEHGQGACYDISRTLEKALRYRGYRVRHAALFEKLLKPGSRSHAATEVRTMRGWLVVENTAPWLALDAGGKPWSFRQPFPASWQSPPPAAVMEFYTRKHTVVYGLYSRHGRFYPPYSPIPDF
jgi:hypothetical protein